MLLPHQSWSWTASNDCGQQKCRTWTGVRVNGRSASVSLHEKIRAKCFSRIGSASNILGSTLGHSMAKNALSTTSGRRDSAMYFRTE